MHLFLETTPKNPPIRYREMCLVFWPQNYNFYPKSHICKRFPFINNLVKKIQSPLRGFNSIGASECLERDRGSGGPPSERSERVYGVN